jgi:GntR family transcriptional regulator/MocR family aminotransferase
METFTIKWKKTTEESLYEQLYNHIKTEIVSGRLRFGTRLPSKKKLIQNLNISQTTVETAYEQLLAEGYIESVPRKGYFVSAKEEFLHRNLPQTDVTLKVSPEKTQHYDYDFYPGLIDTSMFPFKQWRSLYRETICDENQDLLLLGRSIGEFSLREEIRKYLYQSRGVICSAEQIIVGAGIEHLLPQLVSLLGEKAVYGIENPGYPLTKHVLSSQKRKSVFVEVDSEGADVRTIEDSDISVMYVTPSHQFPLGSIMSANRRAILLNWAYKRNDRYIIEDDYDSEFRYYGRTIPSLHSLGEGKKVIYLSTFSKSLMPSLRIGYMVLPKQLMKRYQREFSHYASCVPRIDQSVLAKFMRKGSFEKHLNRMRTVYRKKLETVVKALEPYEDEISISGEKAGLHILLTFPEEKNENRLIKAAQKAQIRVCGLNNFFHKGTDEKFAGIVLGFAGMNEEQLSTGLEKLLKIWFKREKKRV